MTKCLALAVIFVLVACVLAQIPNRRKPPKIKVPEVDQRCMECLCQASSNCDETIKCHNAGGDNYFCGPYVISWAYWHDGGRPGDKGRAHDFETCLTNKTCAQEAVRGYMRKYGQDCDRSGDIDCYDFARIHKLGYGNCGGDAILDTDYWEKLEICYSGYQPPYIGNNDAIDSQPQPADYDYGDGSIQARRKHQ